MKRFWAFDYSWLFGFLAGLIVAVLMFHFRLQADRWRARPVTPHSAPRWIESPEKRRTAGALHFAAWHSPYQHRRTYDHYENSD